MFGQKKEKKKVVEFAYKDRVEVITGFHSGCIGELIDYTFEQAGPQYQLKMYQIKLDNGTVIEVPEYRLRKIT